MHARCAHESRRMACPARRCGASLFPVHRNLPRTDLLHGHRADVDLLLLRACRHGAVRSEQDKQEDAGHQEAYTACTRRGASMPRNGDGGRGGALRRLCVALFFSMKNARKSADAAGCTLGLRAGEIPVSQRPAPPFTREHRGATAVAEPFARSVTHEARRSALLPEGGAGNRLGSAAAARGGRCRGSVAVCVCVCVCVAG